jgi:hypothetical protein
MSGRYTFNVEVVQSQESVAGADLDYINSVFAHNLAKLSLARAVGEAADNLAEFLQTRQQQTGSGAKQVGTPCPSYASVKFAWAFTSRPVNSCRSSFGNAAAAIIAALSVDKPGEGKYTG